MTLWVDITLTGGSSRIEWSATCIRFPLTLRVEIDPAQIGVTRGGWRYQSTGDRYPGLLGNVSAGSVTLFENKLRMWQGQSSRDLLCVLDNFKRGAGKVAYGSLRVGNQTMRCNHEYYTVPKYEAKMTGTWKRVSRPWEEDNKQVWVGLMLALSGAYGVRGEFVRSVVISCTKPHRACVFDCLGGGVGLVRGLQGGGGIALVTGAPDPWKDVHRHVQHGWDFSFNMGADPKAIPALKKLPKVAKWTVDKIIDVLMFGSAPNAAVSKDFVVSAKGIVGTLGIDWHDTGVYFVGLAGGGNEIGVFYKFDQFYVQKIDNLQPALDWLRGHAAALGPRREGRVGAPGAGR